MNGLALCAGVGGLELGLHLALREHYRTLCYVEREAYAAATLVARMEDTTMDRAPIWDDIITFDGRPWRGRVDILSGGYPCTPFSVAGKRLGEHDDRHLWPHVFRIVREVQPRFCFFENVANHLRLGYDAVRADLRSAGYHVEAGIFSAAELGATHRRERLFILAVADAEYAERWQAERTTEGQTHQRRQETTRSCGVCETVADASSARRQQELRGAHGDEGADEGRISQDSYEPERGCQTVGDAAGISEREPHDAERAESWQRARQDAGGRGRELGQPKRTGCGQVASESAGTCEAGEFEWTGAPLADAERSRHDGRALDAEWRPERGVAVEWAGEAVGNTKSIGSHGQGNGEADTGNGRRDSGGTSAELGNADGERRHQAERGQQDGCGPFPPAPGDADGWGEWIAAGGPLPAVCRDAHGMAKELDCRNDRLRCCGNGVVPVVAAKAFITLAAKHCARVKQAEGVKK